MLTRAQRDSRASLVEAEQNPPQPGDFPTGTEFLLLVDDDTVARAPTAELLRRLGYRVEEAETGGTALRILARSLEEVDLLITDVQMPGMTGEELALAVTESRPGAKVLFISGDHDLGGLGEGLNGLTRFLGKPLLPLELARMVREMLDLDPRPSRVGETTLEA